MSDQSSEYLTTKQVSDQFGFFEGTLRYYRHCGIGPASFRMGRRVVYRRSEVEAWIKAQESATVRGGIGA